MSHLWDDERLDPIPYWYSDDLLDSQCACKRTKENTELLHEHVGYSDSWFGRYRCTECGREWCRWIEG